MLSQLCDSPSTLSAWAFGSLAEARPSCVKKATAEDNLTLRNALFRTNVSSTITHGTSGGCEKNLLGQVPGIGNFNLWEKGTAILLKLWNMWTFPDKKAYIPGVWYCIWNNSSNTMPPSPSSIPSTLLDRVRWRPVFCTFWGCCSLNAANLLKSSEFWYFTPIIRGADSAPNS